MINHPFIGSLEEKTLEELSETIGKLNNKLTWAARTRNAALANQIQMALQSYRSELSKRQAEMWKSDSGKMGRIDIN